MKKKIILLIILLFNFYISFAEEKNFFTLKIQDKQIILPLLNINNEPYTNAIEFIKFIGGSYKDIKETPTLVINIKNKNILISSDTSYFVIDGQLTKICCNILKKENKWLIPIDFIKKMTEIVLGKNFFWNHIDSLAVIDFDKNNLLTITTEYKDNKTIISFEGNIGNDYRLIEESKSLSIKFFSTNLLKPYYNNEINDSNVKRIYYTLSPQNVSAYTIELQKTNIPYSIIESKDKKKISIEFINITSPTKEKIEETTTTKTALPEEKKASDTLPKSITTIVIDPGHGGDEVGAVGHKGSYEKDICLSISKILKKILEDNLGIQVFLTRDKDIPLDLIQRTAIANNYKADIFISIHTNASNRKNASGAETYFLSLDATDEESLKLANYENKLIKTEFSNSSPDLNLILWDLAQTEHIQESSQLAEFIQDELNIELSIKNRGVKQAPFRVLMGADMPAVLIEVGFITNPKEEELLNNYIYQKSIANAIFRSILKFKNIREKKYGIKESIK